MTLVTPSLVNSASPNVAAVHASGTSYALNTLAEMFDWSKGAAQKNSARITANNLQSVAPALKADGQLQVAELPNVPSAPEKARTPVDSSADTYTRASLLLEAASKNPSTVPALLARQGKQLNAFEFATLMHAVEEAGNNWSDSEKYFVFTYPSGSVGSVWLGGIEVFNSIWKNY